MDKIYVILISSSVLKDKTDRKAHLSLFGKGAPRIRYKYSGSSQFAHCLCAFTFPWQPLTGIVGSLTKPASTSFRMILPWPLLSLITSRTHHTRSPHSRRQPPRLVTDPEARSCARSSALVLPRLKQTMGPVLTSTDSVSVFVFYSKPGFLGC